MVPDVVSFSYVACSEQIFTLVSPQLDVLYSPGSMCAAGASGIMNQNLFRSPTKSHTLL